MNNPTSCCRAPGSVSAYCDNCDLLVGLSGYRVIGVARGPDGLVVRVESPAGPVGCPDCGVRATSRGRREHRLVDIPAFGDPVRLVWVKRTWACGETTCPRRSFTETDEDLAYTRRFEEAGVPVEVVEAPRMPHGIDRDNPHPVTADFNRRKIEALRAAFTGRP